MQGSEKRVFRRVPVSLTAHCQIGSRFVRDAVSDLSLGGLFLQTRALAREGTPVRVALALPFEADDTTVCSFVGAVARVDRDARGFLRGLGVAFSHHESSAAAREALAGFVARCG